MNTTLPDIKIVRHLRAKKLKLVVSPKGIRLTAPILISASQIKKFIDSNHHWLCETWAKYQTDVHAQQNINFPSTLTFCFDHKPSIHVQYVSQKAAFKFDAIQRIVSINENFAAQGLTQFVREYAKQILSDQLNHYAKVHQLNVTSVRVATPQSRWGSCSSDQKIMLHAGLMLMPEHYADYVILHELAHTKHMNHQAVFWQQLEQWYPNAKQVQKEVRKFRLPLWWQTK